MDFCDSGIDWRMKQVITPNSEINYSELEQGRGEYVVIQNILGHVVDPVFGVLRDPDEGALFENELPNPIDPHFGLPGHDEDDVLLGFMDVLGDFLACRNAYQEDGYVSLVIFPGKEILNLDRQKGVRAPLKFLLSLNAFHITSFLNGLVGQFSHYTPFLPLSTVF